MSVIRLIDLSSSEFTNFAISGNQITITLLELADHYLFSIDDQNPLFVLFYNDQIQGAFFFVLKKRSLDYVNFFWVFNWNEVPSTIAC